MNKQEGFMIRIDSEKHAQLKQISAATSTKMVDIGRHAMDAIIDYSNQVGIDAITFPLRYPKLLETQAATIKELEKRNTGLENLIAEISRSQVPYAAEPPAAYNVTDIAADDEQAANTKPSENGTGKT